MTAPPDISVILPTRGRPRQAEAMLRSLVETAARPERIELVLYVDLDDPASHDVDTQGLHTHRIIGPRKMMGVMTNECYAATTGEQIFLTNDDVRFLTPDWDLTFLDAVRRFPDGVAMVWGNDCHTGGPTHPVLPRALCEAMGGVCPGAYDRVFIDVHLHDIFAKLKTYGHDRMVYLPEVRIEHLHPDAGKAQADATARKRHLQADEMVYIHHEDQRRRLSFELAERIGRLQGTTQSQPFAARAA